MSEAGPDMGLYDLDRVGTGDLAPGERHEKALEKISHKLGLHFEP